MFSLRSTPLAIILGLSLFFSCDEESEMGGSIEKKSIVQFKTETVELNENGNESEIKLKLSPAATKSGQVVLKSDRPFSTLFTTTPAASNNSISISIAKGDSLAILRIKPINNTTYGGEKSIQLYIQSTSPEIQKGRLTMLDLTINDDENENDDPEPVQSLADFEIAPQTLNESNSEGITYNVKLSAPASEASQIRINFSAENGSIDNQFTVQPAPEGNIITLDVPKNESTVSFTVKPVSNTIITGHTSLTFTIVETTGSISKGTSLSKALTLEDDELKGLPKGYESVSADQSDKKTYVYDQLGRISQVQWQTNIAQGTDTYHYNNLGQLVRVNQSPSRELHYLYADNRIYRSEKMVDGVLQDYTEFEYDASGNVAATVSYHKKSDGTFAKGFTGVYLYYFDGNLFKSLIYSDGENPEEPILVASRTYEHYLQYDNPFGIEIAPGLKSQKNLPSQYTYEQNDVSRTYSLSYEFDDQGKMTKRTASTSSTSETAIYHYY